jgi:hypothetical protein
MTLSREDVYRVASVASCDPRTVIAFVEGRAPRGMVRTRIERALAELGINSATPQPAALSALGRPVA